MRLKTGVGINLKPPNMKRKTISLFALVAAAMFSSCASIVSKSNYPIVINSHPSESSILISNSKGMEIFRGHTPATVVLKSSEGFFEKASYQVKFSKPGYEDKVVPLTCKVNGWYWGNLVFGGLIGFLIVDPATGAMFKLDREFLNETLTPAAITDNKPQLNIFQLNEIPPSWREHLVLLED
jgi:hypothetical protein